MKLIGFSAGTESTALLVDSINKYGVDQLMVLTTILTTVNNKTYYKHYEATEYYTKEICKELGISNHKIAYRTMLGATNYGNFGLGYLISDAYILTLSHPTIDDYLIGGHSLDKYSSVRIRLARQLYDGVMEAYERSARYTCPLRDVTKLDQWNMIPDTIKPLVFTCELPYKNEEGIYLACNKCSKCAEFKICVTDKEVALQGATGVC
jgi:hypothetical protein